MIDHHPAGFDFDYSYWFDCECRRRVRVPAVEYAEQCAGDRSYPACACGATVDIGEVSPALRDLGDIDCVDDQVQRHYWYHSSTYEDWPSSQYDRCVAVEVGKSPMSPEARQRAIAAKMSLVLHVGTYASAVENMLRRMKDQDAQPCRYWLHQIRVELRPGELAAGVHAELPGLLGDVRLTALADLGARAARYVNVREAPGSISLALESGVIAQVRTIALSPSSVVIPAVDAGDRAVERAAADLAASLELRPDTSGVPDDQLFASELDIFLAEGEGCRVSAEAKALTAELAPKFRAYETRRDEIWSRLCTEFVDIYLPGTAPQVRERVFDVIAARSDPAELHRSLRELAGPIMMAAQVVEQFETATWRSPATARTR